MLDFVTLASENFLFMGTHEKAYLEDGGTYYDITPLRTTLTLGANPVATGTAGSGIITVTANSHGGSVGGYVNAGASEDGITANEINQNFEILTVPNANTFTVDTGGSASSGSTSGYVSPITAAMEIDIGLTPRFLVMVGAQGLGVVLLGALARGRWQGKTFVFGNRTLGRGLGGKYRRWKHLLLGRYKW